MSILRLQGYRCSMNHAFTYSPMWNKRMLQPLKWMRNLILILYVVIALAQANKLRPAPIVPNPLLCTGRSRFPHNHIHHIHPSFLILKRNTSVLKTFVLATECSLSTWRISPFGYFIKRIFDHLSIFVTSDNFAGLLFSKATNARSHMRVNRMLKETSSPARAFFPPEGAC